MEPQLQSHSELPVTEAYSPRIPEVASTDLRMGKCDRIEDFVAGMRTIWDCYSTKLRVAQVTELENERKQTRKAARTNTSTAEFLDERQRRVHNHLEIVLRRAMRNVTVKCSLYRR